MLPSLRISSIQTLPNANDTMESLPGFSIMSPGSDRSVSPADSDEYGPPKSPTIPKAPFSVRNLAPHRQDFGAHAAEEGAGTGELQRQCSASSSKTVRSDFEPMSARAKGIRRAKTQGTGTWPELPPVASKADSGDLKSLIMNELTDSQPSIIASPRNVNVMSALNMRTAVVSKRLSALQSKIDIGVQTQLDQDPDSAAADDPAESKPHKGGRRESLMEKEGAALSASLLELYQVRQDRDAAESLAQERQLHCKGLESVIARTQQELQKVHDEMARIRADLAAAETRIDEEQNRSVRALLEVKTAGEQSLCSAYAERDCAMQEASSAKEHAGLIQEDLVAAQVKVQQEEQRRLELVMKGADSDTASAELARLLSEKKTMAEELDQTKNALTMAMSHNASLEASSASATAVGFAEGVKRGTSMGALTKESQESLDSAPLDSLSKMQLTMLLDENLSLRLAVERMQKEIASVAKHRRAAAPDNKDLEAALLQLQKVSCYQGSASLRLHKEQKLSDMAKAQKLVELGGASSRQLGVTAKPRPSPLLPVSGQTTGEEPDSPRGASPRRISAGEKRHQAAAAKEASAGSLFEAPAAPDKALRYVAGRDPRRSLLASRGASRTFGAGGAAQEPISPTSPRKQREPISPTNGSHRKQRSDSPEDSFGLLRQESDGENVSGEYTRGKSSQASISGIIEKNGSLAVGAKGGMALLGRKN